MSELYHIGTPRHSGRYPWGSGDNPQRSIGFRQKVKELKSKGFTEKEIADGFGMTTTKLRNTMSLEKAEQRASDAALATRMKNKGMSNVAIAERLNVTEGTVRNLLDADTQAKGQITKATSDMLKKELEEKKYLDIGAGTETQIGISRNKLNTAVSALEEEGYVVQYIKVKQLGTDKYTTVKVLTKDDVSYSELLQNKAEIKTISEWTDDGGRSFLGVAPIKNVDSDRVKVKFAEEGGTDMDGVIQLRRGVEDLSLGDSRYAQVRIGVDGTHYLKGMAIYGQDQDFPNGVDLVFNTNKSTQVGKKGAMKLQELDQDENDYNPFGATIRQKYYIDSNGKEQLSSLNIVGFATKPNSGEEGSWDTWSKTLSSQFLAKQSPALAKKQLQLALDLQKEELDSIMSLTNPAVKARLLDSFADDCDSKAVHLKGASLPRQSTKVLIPITSLTENECYNTSYRNGEKLALIRFPHAGTFEIPVVSVNNKNTEGRSVLGNALDAIGIHPKTAGRLSGADFDGDSVIVIPYTKEITSSKALKGLSDFDTKAAYPKVSGMKTLSKKNEQTEMGKVSNLITDMQIKGAPPSDIVKAVKHSMVVIDARKHELNYQQSAIDNGINELKAKYQGGTVNKPKGASTLLSKAGSEIRVDARRPVTKADIEANPSLAGVVRKSNYSVDPKTGKKVTVPTGETYVNKSGKTIKKQITSTKMFETDDAFSLSSGTLIEQVYANFANDMKSLGDTARKESVNTPTIKYNPSAKKTYSKEVESLKAALKIADSNKPLERQAQLVANATVDLKKKANPDMTAAEVKKISGQALAEARRRTGAGKQKIQITPKEWTAIQAGAVSHNTLTQILNNTDLDLIKQLATPRTSAGLSTSQASRAKQLLNTGYTQAEVADKLGVSTSLLKEL